MPHDPNPYERQAHGKLRALPSDRHFAPLPFPQVPDSTLRTGGRIDMKPGGDHRVLADVHDHLQFLVDLVEKELGELSSHRGMVESSASSAAKHSSPRGRLEPERTTLSYRESTSPSNAGSAAFAGPRVAEQCPKPLQKNNVHANEEVVREWTSWSDIDMVAGGERAEATRSIAAEPVPVSAALCQTLVVTPAMSPYATHRYSHSSSVTDVPSYKYSHVRRPGSLRSSGGESVHSRGHLEDHFARLDVRLRGRLNVQEIGDIMSRSIHHTPDPEAIADMIKYLNVLTALKGRASYSPTPSTGGASIPLTELPTPRGSNHLTDLDELHINLDAYTYLMMYYHEAGVARDAVDLSLLRLAFRKEIQTNFADLNRQVIEESLEASKEQQSRGIAGILLDTIPAFMIMFNALVMGVSLDISPDDDFWDALEIFFYVFFVAEFAVKVKLFPARQLLCGADRYWNWFDLCCIFTSTAEMIITNAGGGGGGGAAQQVMLIKILRLARLGRLIRLLRFKIFHELKMMVQGVVSGMRVLCWAIILLLSCIYFLAIIFRSLFVTQPEFRTVERTMFSLFRCFTDGCVAYNGTPLQERLREDHSPFAMYIYILVYLFVTIGIFNLIMAIFIDNVVTAHIQRKQHELGENAAKMEVRINEVIAKRFEACRQLHKEAKASERLVDSEQITSKENSLTGKLLHKMGSSLSRLTDDGKLKEWEQRKAKASVIISEADEEVVITKDVFNAWLNDHELLDLLEEVEVETSTKYELFDALDVDGGGELTVEELVSGLMKLRGPVSKNDIVATRLKVAYIAELVGEICRNLGIQLSCDGPATASDSDGRLAEGQRQKITIVGGARLAAVSSASA